MVYIYMYIYIYIYINILECIRLRRPLRTPFRPPLQTPLRTSYASELCGYADLRRVSREEVVCKKGIRGGGFRKCGREADRKGTHRFV